MPSVQAYVYDVSQGMASQMSMALVGKHIDIIPHTGIVVFGKEYFFGAGPCIGDPGTCLGFAPSKVLQLGETDKTMQELESHIQANLASEHTQERYNLLTHNCNHYADDVAKFLLAGQGLPAGIVNVADEALSSPQGQQLRVMIETMESQARSQMQGASALNPFGNVSSATTSSALPVAAPPSNSVTAKPAAVEGPVIVPAPGTVTLDGAVGRLLRNPRDVAKTAIQTLISIAENIIHKPQEDKFRRLKLANGALQRKLLGVPGGVDALVALGFVETSLEGEVVLLAKNDRTGIDLLVNGKARLGVECEKLLTIGVDATKVQQNNSTGGILGMLENALKDPASLQRLLSNPMISQMAKANPQMIEGALQSPEVQNSLRQHPEMHRQVEQLIGRPLPASITSAAGCGYGVPNAPPVAPSATTGNSFDAQLAQLAEMGFTNQAACLAALQNSGGDVEVALASLVG